MAIFDNAYKQTRNIALGTLTAQYTIGGGGGGDLPMYMTSVDIQFSRGVSPQYVLNNAGTGDTQLNIVGRPSGILTIGTILAAYKSGLNEFLAAVSKECASEKDTVNLILTPTARCSTDAMPKYIIKGLTLETLNVSIRSGAVMAITDTTRYIFTDMEIGQSSSNNNTTTGSTQSEVIRA